MSYNNRRRCPHCGKLLIDPMGNPNAPILLVGEHPGYNETKTGLPFSFRNPHSQFEKERSGDVLRAELLRVGLTLNDVLVTNLWMHEKATKEVTEGKKKKKVDACPPEFHLNQLVEMFANRTHVLLMGSEVTNALLDVPYTAVSGLQVKIKSLGRTKTHFWAAPNPSLAMSQPIGELRLAFERFAEDVRKTK